MFALNYDIREPIYRKPVRSCRPFAVAALVLATVGFLAAVIYYAVGDVEQIIMEPWETNKPEIFEPVGTVIVNGTVTLQSIPDDFTWTFYFHQDLKFDSIEKCKELLRVGFQTAQITYGDCLT